jgi:diguanylate cyclase (GGDEF)-like protein/PAS domain S-box-containing protein
MKKIKELTAFAESLFDGVVEIDSAGRILLWNKGAERITGYAAAGLIGIAFQSQPVKHRSDKEKDLPGEDLPLMLTVKDGRPRESLLSLQHAEGYQVLVLVRTLAVLDEKARIIGAIEIFSDNKAIQASFQTSRKSEETIFFDPVTGIGNRPHIENRIRYALEDFHSKNIPFGVLFLDIDHFKDFNDAHGHPVGDKILRVVANTLRHSLRLTDSCGRWGGEEFVALAFNLDGDGLSKVAEKVRSVIAETKVRENERELSVTVSIGSTLARAEDTLQSLIKRADELMYESKRAGRDRVTTGD